MPAPQHSKYPPPLPIHVALYILRTERGLSQRQLALQAGVGRAIYSYYERGKRTPSLRILSWLAEALGTNIANFLELAIHLSRIDLSKPPLPIGTFSCLLPKIASTSRPVPFIAGKPKTSISPWKPNVKLNTVPNSCD